MPRPKRAKVAPSAPTQLRAKPAHITSAAQKQQERFSPVSSGRVTTGSDDSDGLVKTRRGSSGKRAAVSQQYTMSGALPPEDFGTTRSRPPSNQTRAALFKIAREADHAKAVEAAEARKNPPRQSPNVDTVEIPSSIPTDRVAPSTGGTITSTDAHGHSMLRQDHQGGLSASQGTPLFQLSMLRTAAFKKRARQPSLLKMVESQNRHADDSSLDDIDDFRPDDESTPLIKSLSQSNQQLTSSSTDHTSGSRKRKQTTPDIQVPASQTAEPRFSPSTVQSQLQSQLPEQDGAYDLAPRDDQSDHEPTLPRLRSTQTPQTQIFNDILAPPRSSSPLPAPVQKRAQIEPTKKSTKSIPQQKIRRKQLSPAPSPVSSSTSTHPSPIRPIHLKPLATATLQNLLPRRRTRPKPKGDYDVPSSSDVELDNTGLGEDEDELSFHASSKVRRKPLGKSKGGMQKVGGVGKGKAAGGGTAKRTYTRKSVLQTDPESETEGGASDNERDENGVAGRTRTTVMNGRVKEEMKRLASKFREVDEFTLDFEDMTGSSSQMMDAR